MFQELRGISIPVPMNSYTCFPLIGMHPIMPGSERSWEVLMLFFRNGQINNRQRRYANSSSRTFAYA
jgi:hypothetical protein